MEGRSISWPDAGPGSRLERRLMLAGSAAILFLAVLSLFLTAVFSPGNTVRRFRRAMDARDFSALCKVAAPAERNTAFTEQAAQPLFRLWREDAQFRAQMEEALEEETQRLRGGGTAQPGGAAVRLLARPAFLHTAYTVQLGTGRAAVKSNLANATLLLDSGAAAMSVGSETDAGAADGAAARCADYPAVFGGSASFGSLLPGIYGVTGRYATAYGETFEASTTVKVYAGTTGEASLQFDCCSLNVYNAGQTPASVWMGERQYWRLDGGAELRIGPLRPTTLVTARPADAAQGSVPAQSASAGSGSFSMSFDPCRVEIRNTYPLPIAVWEGSRQAGVVPAQSSLVLDDLTEGTELTLRLNKQDAAQPWIYTCQHPSDYLCPVFSLSPSAKAAILQTVCDYADACFRAFNSADTGALGGLTQTGLSEYLYEALSARKNRQTEGSAMRLTFFMETPSLSTCAFGAAEDGAPEVTAYMEIPYRFRSPSGSEENVESVYRFTLRAESGSWTIGAD